MGKKEKSFINLSAIDHKMQFIKIIAVIGDIIPIISRAKKLIQIEVCLLDETVTRPGFKVKLKLESEVLNHFLNVAKKGFIIQLNDIKVIKNEGEVYGEVKEEEEITLYNDSTHIHKWFPGEEKPTVESDAVKLKITGMVKWKKTNLKDLEVLQENNEEKLMKRRSGPVELNSKPSKSQNRISINDSSNTSNKGSPKMSSTNQQVVSKPREDILKGTTSKRTRKLDQTNPKVDATKHLRGTKMLSSSDESESSSLNSSRSSILSSLSRTTRASDISNFKSSLSKLNKSLTSRTLNKSISLSSLKKSASLPKLNKSQSQTNLDNSIISTRGEKVAKAFRTKKESSESSKSVRLTRSISTPKINKAVLTSDSDNNETSSDQSSFKSPDCRFSPRNRKADKDKSESSFSETESPVVNKIKEILHKNNMSKLLRNKKTNYDKIEKNTATKKKSKSNNSKNETEIPTRKSPAKNQKDSSSQDIIATNLKEMEAKFNNLESNCKTSIVMERNKADNKSFKEEKPHTSESLKRTRQTTRSEHERSPDLVKRNRSFNSNTNKSFKRKNLSINETEVNSKLRENIHIGSSKIIKAKGVDSDSDTPTSKKIRLTSGSENSSETSETFKPSPKSKQKSGNLLKNPTLNSSDSSLSGSPKRFDDKTTSRRNSQLKNKCDSNHTDTSVSKKKLKLDLETDNNEYTNSRPQRNVQSPLRSPVDEGGTKKSNIANETVSKDKFGKNSNEKDIGCNSRTNQSESWKDEKDSDHRDAKGPEKAVTTAPRKHGLQKSDSNEDLLRKKTRNSANSVVSSAKSSRESGKDGIFENYLTPLTKKLNFISVDNITDISICDIEEVYVPEKFDLQCKVVSEFIILEDGIQVIRVQDGTTCKSGTLKIPPGNSWEAVTKEILENPTVEEKSPYIDIIIFNYFRMDFPIKSDKFFQINNVMALKFQLKTDPRKEKRSKSELFFCVEGQNTFVKKLPHTLVKELQEKISAQTQKIPPPPTLNEKTIPEKPSMTLTRPSNTSKVECESNLLDKKSPLKPPSEERVSTPKQKTKNVNDSNIDSKVVYPKRKSTEDNSIKKLSEICENKPNSIGNIGHKTNTTNSSDETLMGETPPLLREINEIMHEESVLGLPFTNTEEDIHLKNSGSEVTFSQFCKEAKLKGDNFRTSTQEVETDVRIADSPFGKKLINLPKAINEVVVSEDTSKMEPLVYCPSGSSASSAACGSPDKRKPTQGTQDSQECSVSLLNKGQLKTTPDLGTTSSNSKKLGNDNMSDLSNSSSVKVISSDSSVGIDLQVLDDKIVSDRIQSATKIAEVKVGLLVTQGTKDGSSRKQDEVSSPLRKTVLEEGTFSGKNQNEANTNNDIEILSDKSFNDSLIIADNNTTTKPKSFNASTITSGDLSEYELEQCGRLIPDKYLYKSTTAAPILTEDELNEMYEDENSSVKFLSYCRRRHLPKLTLEVIEKIENTNSLTLTVTFVSISPPFTDLWREKCMKARCPSCEKLYDVFNAANNKNNADASATATAAISVGSHIVCPDSQCCNQILENPAFHFTVEMKLRDGTPVTSLLEGEHAENVFGCTASEAIRNESALNRVAEVLEKISNFVRNKQLTKVVVKRKDIFDLQSGPLHLAHIAV